MGCRADPAGILSWPTYETEQKQKDEALRQSELKGGS